MKRYDYRILKKKLKSLKKSDDRVSKEIYSECKYDISHQTIGKLRGAVGPIPKDPGVHGLYYIAMYLTKILNKKINIEDFFSENGEFGD